MSVASLVLGLWPVVPLVGSLLAVVFGVVAKRQIKESQGREHGSAMATWGIVLGILELAAIVIAVVVLIVVAAHDNSTNQY